jgi:predicted DNA-binding transcriptional regulator YafY
MRAYDVEKDQFSDFVLSRIEAASVSQEDCPHPRPDAQWQQITALKLQADPALNARQREQVWLRWWPKSQNRFNCELVTVSR